MSGKKQGALHDWLGGYQQWRAQRWLDRRARLIRDVPTWRLLQELQQRGALVAAGDADGLVRDRDGNPLFRLISDDRGAS
jgi:hypothetical protein